MPGFCPVERDPENPDEVALPTITQVSCSPSESTTKIFNEGWGFCHSTCKPGYKFTGFNLKMVRLTILSDRLCKELGNAPEDYHNRESVVNTRIELCGAFVNELNVTTINYTMNEHKGKYSQRLFNLFFGKMIIAFDLSRYAFSPIDLGKYVNKESMNR